MRVEGFSVVVFAFHEAENVPTVLREIRDLGERVKAIPGVVDVRSVVDPVMLLNEALGGRRGIPETLGRAGRVLTYLQGHPAVAQLMTSDGGGALIYIKLLYRRVD